MTLISKLNNKIAFQVCRACAAFFRRSVACKKRFVCRRGGDNCHLNTPRKVTCQKCRWVKCLEVGLQKECMKNMLYKPNLVSLFSSKPEDRNQEQQSTIGRPCSAVEFSSGFGQCWRLRYQGWKKFINRWQNYGRRRKKKQTIRSSHFSPYSSLNQRMPCLLPVSALENKE